VNERWRRTRDRSFDSGRSSATIEVGKSGAFSFVAGHSHEVVAPAIAGTITVDADDPVAVRMDSNTLTATGRFTVKQKDHGSKPVSVGGVVSVKDAVNASFTIVGRAAGS
jgi:hypothetical protein